MFFKKISNTTICDNLIHYTINVCLDKHDFLFKQALTMTNVINGFYIELTLDENNVIQYDCFYFLNEKFEPIYLLASLNKDEFDRVKTIIYKTSRFIN